MARKAGVQAEDTKATLLEAAARIFARRGYDGASIADIVSEAGLTSGAIYAHYASKAELFLATLEAFAERDIDQLLGRVGAEFAEALTSIGSNYDRREPTEASLLISALVAARNDPEVARLLFDQMAGREKWLTDAVRDAQRVGGLTSEISPSAISRLALVVAFGSLVAGAVDLESVDHEEWSALMTRLVGAFRV